MYLEDISQYIPLNDHHPLIQNTATATITATITHTIPCERVYNVDQFMQNYQNIK